MRVSPGRVWEGAWRRLWLTLAVTLLVLLLAYQQGRAPSKTFLVGLFVLGIAVVLVRRPRLGLPALIVAALAIPFQLRTGTEVTLNLVTLAIPAMVGLWFLDGLRRRDLRVVSARTNRPLFLFLVAGLLSLGLGTVFWDPLVSRQSNLVLVQLAQWGIFALSAASFWLPANLRLSERALRRLVFLFLLVGGVMALLRVFPGMLFIYDRLTTGAVDRAPFWLLLSAVAGGQLLYNRQLGAAWRIFLVALLAAVLYYVLGPQREALSNWIGVLVVAAVLIWLRFPRLHGLLVPLLFALLGSGIIFRALFGFAGGEEEWVVSGGSRLVLIGRVMEVTMRNPLTGLGPAAYRAYAAMEPLPYGNAFWVKPAVNSHNNYVDLYAHIGLLGLGLFLWFMAEVAALGWRLRRRLEREGFMAGFVDGMLAAWVGALVLMLLADWILPHVYNIGFGGFQASALWWLFLGGLLVVDRLRPGDRKAARSDGR